MKQIGISFEFQKADATGRFVRGWALVAEMDGNPIIDWQGDRVSMTDLRKAAHMFITDARVAKAMHDGDQIGEVVESVIVDDEFVKSLGVTDTRRGWFIGMRIDNEAVQKRIRTGELKMFSIGGRGTRLKLKD